MHILEIVSLMLREQVGFEILTVVDTDFHDIFLNKQYIMCVFIPPECHFTILGQEHAQNMTCYNIQTERLAAATIGRYCVVILADTRLTYG